MRSRRRFRTGPEVAFFSSRRDNARLFVRAIALSWQAPCSAEDPMMPRLPALLLTLCTSVALAADPPVLVNPAFDRADPATGAPAGWSVAGDAKNVRVECEAACVLHVHGDDGGAQDAAVYQTVAPGGAAGHRLILSGRIRSERIDGHAGLMVRVIGDAGELGVQQGEAAAPDRAGEWRKVEVAVPVPANATGLIIVAGLHGKGDAWIDRLALKVDDSVTVAAVTPPPPVAPPRPTPSQHLLDDAARKIADADMPAISVAWRDDARARVRPIRSLFSVDFSDLQFLKPLLEGKRIVLLGEAAHGVAESNWAKVRLIKFLHEQMGFDVVAFESSFDQCYDADKLIGKLTPHDVMARCLFPLWHTREVDGLFDYMAAARKTATPLALAGFDIQVTTPRVDKTRLRRMLAVADSKLAASFDDYERESEPSHLITARRSAELQAYFGAIATTLGTRRPQLGPRDSTLRTSTWKSRRRTHGHGWRAATLTSTAVIGRKGTTYEMRAWRRNWIICSTCCTRTARSWCGPTTSTSSTCTRSANSPAWARFSRAAAGQRCTRWGSIWGVASSPMATAGSGRSCRRLSEPSRPCWPTQA
jgi:hypothetical protein